MGKKDLNTQSRELQTLRIVYSPQGQVFIILMIKQLRKRLKLSSSLRVINEIMQRRKLMPGYLHQAAMIQDKSSLEKMALNTPSSPRVRPAKN